MSGQSSPTRPQDNGEALFLARDIESFQIGEVFTVLNTDPPPLLQCEANVRSTQAFSERCRVSRAALSSVDLFAAVYVSPTRSIAIPIKRDIFCTGYSEQWMYESVYSTHDRQHPSASYPPGDPGFSVRAAASAPPIHPGSRLFFHELYEIQQGVRSKTYGQIEDVYALTEKVAAAVSEETRAALRSRTDEPNVRSPQRLAALARTIEASLGSAPGRGSDSGLYARIVTQISASAVASRAEGSARMQSARSVSPVSTSSPDAGTSRLSAAHSSKQTSKRTASPPSLRSTSSNTIRNIEHELPIDASMSSSRGSQGGVVATSGSTASTIAKPYPGRGTTYSDLTSRDSISDDQRKSMQDTERRNSSQKASSWGQMLRSVAQTIASTVFPASEEAINAQATQSLAGTIADPSRSIQALTRDDTGKPAIASPLRPPDDYHDPLGASLTHEPTHLPVDVKQLPVIPTAGAGGVLGDSTAALVPTAAIAISLPSREDERAPSTKPQASGPPTSPQQHGLRPRASDGAVRGVATQSSYRASRPEYFHSSTFHGTSPAVVSRRLSDLPSPPHDRPSFDRFTSPRQVTAAFASVPPIPRDSPRSRPTEPPIAVPATWPLTSPTLDEDALAHSPSLSLASSTASSTSDSHQQHTSQFRASITNLVECLASRSSAVRVFAGFLEQDTGRSCLGQLLDLCIPFGFHGRPVMEERHSTSRALLTEMCSAVAELDAASHVPSRPSMARSVASSSTLEAVQVVPAGEQRSEALSSHACSRLVNRVEVTTGLSTWLTAWQCDLHDALLQNAARSSDAGDALASHVVQVRARFGMSWGAFQSLPFLGKTDISTIITWTSDEQRCQALSCGDYLERLWPNIDKTILSTLWSSQRQGTAHCWINHGTLEVNMESTEGSLTVDMKGPAYELFEVLELLTWLGASCCPALRGQEVFRCATVLNDELRGMINIAYYEYAIERWDMSPEMSCWRQLSHSFIIADGFPLLRERNQEPGVEMSLEVMTSLGAVEHLALLRGAPFLKGYSTVFSPMVYHHDSIVWHFEAATDDEWISLSDDRPRMPVNGLTLANGMETLRSYRHFIGWTGAISRNIATTIDVHEDDDFIDCADDTGPPLTLLEGAEMPQFRSIRQEMPSLAGGNAYGFGFPIIRLHQLLMRASSLTFVLMDVAASIRKGTLMNGVDTLAHLTFSRLRTAAFLRSISEASREALKQMPVLSHNMTVDDTTQYLISHEREAIASDGTSLGDVLREMWEPLASIASIQQQRLVSLESSSLPRDILEGWPLGAVVRQSMFPRPLAKYLLPASRGWRALTTELRAPALLGENLGDIMLNTSGRSCRWCLKAPGGHDYISASVEDLHDIYKRQRRYLGFAASITNHCGWYQSNHKLFSGSTGDTGCLQCCSALLHEVVPLQHADDRSLVQVAYLAGGAVVLGSPPPQTGPNDASEHSLVPSELPQGAVDMSSGADLHDKGHLRCNNVPIGRSVSRLSLSNGVASLQGPSLPKGDEDDMCNDHHNFEVTSASSQGKQRAVEPDVGMMPSKLADSKHQSWSRIPRLSSHAAKDPLSRPSTQVQMLAMSLEEA